MSEFRASFWAADEAEAYRMAVEACDRYYGDKPYAFDVDGTERRTFDGAVRGYDVEVSATDDVRTEPLGTIEAESTNGRRCEGP